MLSTLLLLPLVAGLPAPAAPGLRPTPDAAFQDPAPPPAPPPPATGQQELGPDTVIATVGEQQIRLQDLLAEVNRLIPLTTYHGKVPEDQQFEFRDRALHNLIERSLVFQDAERRGIEASDAELRAELKKSIRTAGADERVDEEMFEELLVQLRATIRKRVLIDKNEARFLATVPPVTDAQLREAYEAQKEHLVAPQMMHVREILLKVPPGSTEEQALAVRDRLGELLEELRGGADFETLAMLHSEHETGPAGGDRGWIPAGRMRARELNDALAGLQDGGVSGPVRTRWGYHLLQRVATEAPRTMRFEEVETGLRRELEKRHEADARAAWTAELRAAYPVSVSELLPRAPTSADATPADPAKPGAD